MEEETKKSTVSFGFTKKFESKKLEKSAADVTGNLNEGSEQTDFVTSLEGKKINSSVPKLEVKKQFIIPLIKENKWRYDEDGKERNDLESKAVQEILENAAQQNQEWEDRDKADPNLTVPLLMRNKVPDGFETDDNLNVSLRPDEPMEANYESIPIDQFGFAMLRGMGWKEGEGLGKDKSVVDPVQAVLRPKGLGLGADKRNAVKTQVNGSVENEDESLTYKKGAFCVLTKGPQTGLYGTIEGIDEDNARVMVKITLTKQTATLSQYGIQLVGQKEYDKCSRLLNKLKVDKYKDESRINKNYDDGEIENLKEHSNEENNGKRKSSHKDRHSHEHSSKHDKHRSNHSKTSKTSDQSDDHHGRSKHSSNKHESDSDRKRRYKRDQKYSTSEDEANSSSGKYYKKQRIQKPVLDNEENCKTSISDNKLDENRVISVKKESVNGVQDQIWKDQIWTCPNLKVRIIDRKYKNGKYFKSKVVIVDVVSKNNCICKTADGQILENVSQDYLETVIPRDSDDQKSIVMLTGTTLKGRVGEIISRNKSKSQLLIRLPCSQYDDEKIVTIDSYDHACEYVGRFEDE